MFCPNCGEEYTDEKFCPACGHALLSTDISVIPSLFMGRYEAIDGYIELSYYTVTIHKNNDTRSTELNIVYEDIVDVVYQEPTEDGIGLLAIQHVDQTKPPARSGDNMICNDTSLLFEKQQRELFRIIYSYLSQFPAKRKSKGASNPRHLLSKKGICCPRCGSQRFVIYRFPRHFPPGIKSPFWRLISNLLILYSVVVLEGKKLECIDCGFMWFP